MINISVVVVNYNVKDMLLRCLSSLYSRASDGISLEVILVDNDSKDGSVRAVKEQFKEVKIIENNFNAGFSGGNNQGMKLATGEYILLLNPDTEICGEALLQMKNYMDQHPEVAILAPQLLNKDNSIQTSAWKKHGPADLILETVFLHKIFDGLNYSPEQLNSTFQAGSLSGAALFFRRSLVDKIGMMDEELFWMEDVDLCRRASEHGTLTYLHSAKIKHYSGQSQKKNYNIAISNQLLSKLKYYQKNASYFGYILALFFCFFFILSRLIAFGLLLPVKEVYKLKARAYVYSMKRFFRYLFLNDKGIV